MVTNCTVIRQKIDRLDGGIKNNFRASFYPLSRRGRGVIFHSNDDARAETRRELV